MTLLETPCPWRNTGDMYCSSWTWRQNADWLRQTIKSWWICTTHTMIRRGWGSWHSRAINLAVRSRARTKILFALPRVRMLISNCSTRSRSMGMMHHRCGNTWRKSREAPWESEYHSNKPRHYRFQIVHFLCRDRYGREGILNSVNNIQKAW